MAGAAIPSIVIAQTSPIPLTTAFTPPPECVTDRFTLGPAISEDHDEIPTVVPAVGSPLIFRGARSECYPPSFSVSATSYNSTVRIIAKEAPYTTSGTWVTSETMLSRIRLYSPGICPSGYIPRSQDSSGAVTYQTCCPAGMALNTFCASLPSTPLTVLSSTGEHGIAEIGATARWGTTVYTTLTRDPEWIFAYPVVVAWEKSDLGVIFPQKVQSDPSGDVFASSQGSFTARPAPSLSIGATIGIGLGGAVVVAILVAGLWVALWREHKQRLAARNAAYSEASQEKAELSGPEKPQWASTTTELDMEHAIHECDGEGVTAEADCSHARIEMDAGWRGCEAPDEDRKS